jgi:hypothetical protein
MLLVTIVCALLAGAALFCGLAIVSMRREM